MADFASELSEGLAAIEALVAEHGTRAADWNEAETRLHLINRILSECLGWPTSEWRLEVPQGRSYTDYELDTPTAAIWEAKREGKAFEIPVRRSGGLIHKLASVMAVSAQAKEAIEQVNGYCISRGVELAVATNGHQLIAFRAVPELLELGQSRGLVFDSLDHLRLNFPRAWQCLSPGGVSAGNLFALLDRSSAPKPPAKLATTIPDYPQQRQPTALQRSLSDIAELLLLSVEEQEELEEQFYQRCYSESGALNQHALISKQLLSARYASLFPDAVDAPEVAPVRSKDRKAQLTPAILAEAISNRPIALVGDVGVGKSSFLKHLMFVSAYPEFQHALYAYVNLGRKGSLQTSVQELVLGQIERSLIDNYGIDIFENDFVRAVYKDEIKRFEKSIYGSLQSSNPEVYELKLLEMIAEKQSNRSEHLRLSIAHLASKRRKQIIIALDNADQRRTEIQSEAFVIAQNLAAEWKAAVFISVRPKTFFLSKRAGVMSAYPHRVFTVAPPRIDDVIIKRLVFALEIAEGRVQMEQLQAISLQLGNIATFVKVLLASIEKHDDVKIFIENITGGNIRELIQFLSGMFGNPNIDTQGAILALEESGAYTFPVHEFWKVAFKGEYQYYDPEKTLAANIFDVYSNDPREHFLMPLVLALLDMSGPHRTAEGFVAFAAIVAEMQSLGFKPASVEACVRAANNKKLIEAPDRITFEEDDEGIYGMMPSSFRLSTTGAYHLKVWGGNFAYLDAMCVDTPIFDPTVHDEMREHIRSHSLADRYDRAVRLRDYLSKVWAEMGTVPPFFDWDATCRVAQSSFDKVETVVSRREAATTRPAIRK